MITLSFLVLVIEKAGDEYAGYSPNVTGVSAVGISREEVERSLLDQINAHVDKLKARHEGTDQRFQIASGPIEETITCIYSLPPGHWKSACEKSAQKEGLCWQHWKMLYGHEIDTHAKFRNCELCGESRPYILGNWAAPCDFKTTNNDWRSVLAKKRSVDRTERKERRETEEREKVYARMPIQCKGQRTKGGPCSNEAQKDELCPSHWRKAYGHDYWSGDGGCRLCGEKNYDILSTWAFPCPRKVKALN